MKIAKDYESLNAVHMDDLESLLNSCGIFDKYENKLIKCKFCRDTVDNENIYSVFKDSGSYKLVCDKPECMQALLGLINKRKEVSTDAS